MVAAPLRSLVAKRQDGQGLVRGGVPRWIPGLWMLFIVWDFTIGAVGPVDPHWLYLAGAVGLAAHLVRRGTAARAGA